MCCHGRSQVLDISAAAAHVLGVLQRVRRLEVLAVRKLIRLQEVEQAPQLLDAVLQRRPRDEHLVAEMPLLKLLHMHTVFGQVTEMQDLVSESSGLTRLCTGRRQNMALSTARILCCQQQLRQTTIDR